MIIAICSTRNWYIYLATELYALFKHNEVAKVYLFIEDDEISYLKDSRIKFINVNKLDKYITEYSPNYNTKYTRMTLVRCYFSKIINEEKILYIDADAIVVDNIKELWNIDIKNKAVAGVKENGEWSKHLGIEGMDNKYINSGVLLMNLEYIRKEKLDDAMIDLLNKRYYAYPDQDVINIVCKDKIKYIKNIYNSAETTGIIEDAKIIHYIREHKGWIKESQRSDIWYRYFLETIERSNNMVKVECIVEYDDVQLNERIPIGKQFEVTNDRADYLANERKLVKIIEVIPELAKEPEVEEASEPVEETPEEEKPVEKKATKKARKK